jgi:hypothetical protein
MNRSILVLIISSLILSCGGSGGKNSEMRSTDPVVTETGETEITTFLPQQVSDFDVIYYKKPFTDSVRYTRYFLTTHTTDSALVSELNRIFLGTFEKLPEVKKCQSEGKIIIPFGGDAFRVIYFSRTGGDCSYIYYIRDGEFYYFSMSTLLSEKLDAIEKMAVEPK